EVAVRRPVLVLAVWLAVVAVGFGVGLGVFERLTSEVGVVPGSESQRTEERIGALVHEPAVITAVVTGKPAGDTALRSSVDQALADPGAGRGGAGVPGPQPATDGQALLVNVPLRPDVAGAAKAAAARLVRLESAVPGADVTVSGGPLTDSDFNTQARSDIQ